MRYVLGLCAAKRFQDGAGQSCIVSANLNILPAPQKSIVGDCRQMKVDVDSYSAAHPEAEPIQIVFDFTMDLAKLEAADEAA
jgi:hypothetical protein